MPDLPHHTGVVVKPVQAAQLVSEETDFLKVCLCPRRRAYKVDLGASFGVAVRRCPDERSAVARKTERKTQSHGWCQYTALDGAALKVPLNKPKPVASEVENSSQVFSFLLENQNIRAAWGSPPPGHSRDVPLTGIGGRQS